MSEQSLFKMWINPSKIQDQISYAMIRYRSGERIKHSIEISKKDESLEVDVKLHPNYPANSAIEAEFFSNNDVNIYRTII